MNVGSEIQNRLDSDIKKLKRETQNRRDSDIKNGREKPETETCERKMGLAEASAKIIDSNGIIPYRELKNEQINWRERVPCRELEEEGEIELDGFHLREDEEGELEAERPPLRLMIAFYV